MTWELCASLCTGYTYFGVEYGIECFCGNQINVTPGISGEFTPNPTSKKLRARTGLCNFPCQGNSEEICGGEGRINIFQTV
jgi:hypothetical protein